MTPESNVKLKIRSYLDTLKPSLWYLVHTATGYGPAGIPDIVGCYKGRFFSIECKAPLKKPKVWQQRMRDEEIIPAGGLALVADDLETVMRAFEPFKDAL